MQLKATARRCILHVFWRGNRESSGKHVAVFYNMLYFGEGIVSFQKARRSILHVFRRGNRESSGKHVAVFYMYFGEGIASRVESTPQYFTTSILARESPVEWKARRSILQHLFWRGNRQSSGKHVAVFCNIYFGEGIASRVESTSQYYTTSILARESPVEWKARGADRLQTNQRRLANKSTER